MLSKPNVKEILPKVGNRYQASIALAKRARQIEAQRSAKRKEAKEKGIEYHEDITDGVELAAREIDEGKIYIKINGEYTIVPESEMDREIRETEEKLKENNTIEE